jgi:type IV pilus assembly protein PilY1
MKRSPIIAVALKWMVCFSLVLANQTHALLPLSNSPLFLGGNISPNVMFTLDDSGSMHWEIMPDASIYSYFLFPRAASVYNSGSDYSIWVPTFVDGFPIVRDRVHHKPIRFITTRQSLISPGPIQMAA